MDFFDCKFYGAVDLFRHSLGPGAVRGIAPREVTPGATRLTSPLAEAPSNTMSRSMPPTPLHSGMVQPVRVTPA